MSFSNSSDKRIVVWVQKFKDRDSLMLQWNDPDTCKRKSKSAETTDPDLAETKRSDLEYELNHGKYQEVSRMSWERFRELFEDEYVAARRRNTQENYTAMFNAFERLCRPGMLRTVTARTVSRFAAALRKEPGKAKNSNEQAPSTIRQRLALLRTALGWAVDQGLLPKLPVFPTIKVPKRKPQPIPPESFERLLAKAATPDIKAFLLAGWLGGLRLHEAFFLEWKETSEAPWINFAADRIIFPAEFAKAGEDQWVPLDPVLRTALGTLPRQGRKVFQFVSKRTKDALTIDGIGERIRRLAQKAGVRLTMHSLRKGFGCRYAGRVPAQVLQKLMRHHNISLTMTYYANVDDAAMNAVLGDKRTEDAQAQQSRNSLRNTTDISGGDSNDKTTQILDGEGT
jgi:integrase